MPSIMPGLYHKEQKLYNRGWVSYLWIFFFFRVRSSNLGELESQINSLPPKGHEVGCWKGRNKHSGLVTNFLSFQPSSLFWGEGGWYWTLSIIQSILGVSASPWANSWWGDSAK